MVQPPSIKPMELGEILDSAITLYKKRFPHLVAAYLPVTYFYLVYNLEYWFIHREFSFYGMMGHSYVDFVGYCISYSSLHFPWELVGLSLIYVVLVYPLAAAAVTKICSDSILYDCCSVRDAYKTSVKSWHNVGITNAVVTNALVAAFFACLFMIIMALDSFFIYFDGGAFFLAIFIIFFAGLLPVFFLWSRMAVVFPVLVNEGRSVTSLKKSWNLTATYTKKVFFAVFLISLLPLMILFSALVLEELFTIPSSILVLAFGAAAQGVVIPLLHVTRVIIYFDLKARKEGFDLETQVGQLAEPSLHHVSTSEYVKGSLQK